MDFVEQLKSSVDIVGVVGEYVRLRKSGAQPLHGAVPVPQRKDALLLRPRGAASSTNASAAARAAMWSISCMEIEGSAFYEALKTLAERYGIPMPKRSQYADEDSQAARRPLPDARAGAGELPRQSRRRRRGKRRAPTWRGGASRRKPSNSSGWATRTAPGARCCALLEQRNFAAAQMEQSGLVRQAATTAASTTASATA